MDGIQTPLLSALAALLTCLVGFQAKIKKHIKKTEKIHDYLYGDEDKKGAITRLRELEILVKGMADKDPGDLDLSTIILAQQKAIKEALIPIYKQLDKKADQELFNIQIEHLMEAIERIGRGQS